MNITTATIIDWINNDQLVIDNDSLLDDARSGAAIRVDHNFEELNRRANRGDQEALTYLAAEAERYNAECGDFDGADGLTQAARKMWS
jgi:hypothetical protein